MTAQATPRQAAEAALRASEARLRAVFETSRDAIGVSVNGLHVFVNPAYLQLFGFDREADLAGRPILDLIAPSSHADVMEKVRRRAAGLPNPAIYEVRARRRDGSEFDLEVHSSHYDVDGVRHTLVILRDITERKLHEASLRASERRFRALFEQSRDVVTLVDRQGRVMFHSPSYQRVTGRDPATRHGKGALELVHPDDLPAIQALMQDVLQTPGAVRTTNLRIVHADGGWRWVEGMATNHLDEPAIDGVVINFRDITERKHAEEQLQHTLVALQEAQEIAELGSYEFDIVTNRWSASPTLDRLLGLDPAAVHTYELWASCLHADEREAMLGYFAGLLREHREHFDREYRIVRAADGSTRWVHGLGRLTYSQAGVALHMVGTIQDVTARKRVDDELRRSRQEWQTIFQAIGQPVVILSPEHRVLAANDAVLRAFNATEQALLGKPCWELFHGADHASADCPMRRMLAGKRHASGTMAVEALGGTYMVSCTPMLDEQGAIEKIIHIAIDVSGLKVVEETLRSQAERLKLHIDHTPLGYIEWTPDLVVTEWNPAAERLFGYTRAEALGHTAYELIIPTNVIPQVKPIHDALTADRGGERSTNDNVSKDGRHIVCEWYNTPLRSASGQVVGVASLVQDITDRKHAEDERLKLERQMQHVQKLESLGVLAGGIAHDFNNILMAVLGHADLALSSLSPVSPARENVTEIEKAARRAADLTKQMLAYSGKGRFVVQTLELREVVEEMTHMLEVSISKKAVLRFNFGKTVPPVQADATQLRQIIMNLVINASEAIGDRSGVIAISTGAMECDRAYLATTWLDEGLAEGLYSFVEVADSGIGMDRETLGKIFDPFFSTKFTGRGLGLAAVLGIVRGHKGAIKVYSEPGRGTTFKVLLPAVLAPAERLAEEAGLPEGWHGHGKVLLVDDEETVRMVGKKMLKQLGFEPLLADNGREALRLFAAVAGEVRAVILDLTMPHMDGEETYRELRRLRPDVQVVLSSGYNEQEVVQRFAGKGLAGFIQKPYTLAELAKKLKGVLLE